MFGEKMSPHFDVRHSFHSWVGLVFNHQLEKFRDPLVGKLLETRAKTPKGGE